MLAHAYRSINKVRAWGGVGEEEEGGNFLIVFV